MATAVLSRPSPGSITSGFGPRTGPGSSNHQGIDFSWAKNGVQNWNIYAAADGTIVFAGYSGGFGNLIIIDHGNNRRTYYAHQARFIKTSGKVKRGEIIGIIGNTGSSLGAHLHFEYRINNKPVDPMPYFVGGGSTKPPTKENDMPAVIKRTEGIAEWSLVHPGLRGPDEKQRGYIVTTDPERARWWTRFYETGFDSSDKFNRAEYIAAQEVARLDHEAWLRGQSSTSPEIDYDKLAEALSKLPLAAPTAAEVAEAVDIALADDFAGIPTATDNGQAAREAIVRD